MLSRRSVSLSLGAASLFGTVGVTFAQAAERHLMYVASPGTDFTDIPHTAGILVCDVRDNFKVLREIPTFDYPAGEKPRSIRGMTVSAKAGRLYVTDGLQIIAIDLRTDKKLWQTDPQILSHFDRIAVSPDGSTIYAPGPDPNWYVIDGATGSLVKKIDLAPIRSLYKSDKSVPHNTVFGPDGTHVYLADARANKVLVFDGKTNEFIRSVGPFSHRLRPLTVNGSNSLVIVNVYELLGFEIGDVNTGQKLHRVEVQGFTWDPKKPPPHSVDGYVCPSHGVAMSPDEKEIWVTDGSNGYLHVFDSTVMPPRQVASIKTRTPPYWVTFSLDGKYVFPSSGDVIDARSRKIVAGLSDEKGQQMASEKLLEIVFDATGNPLKAGDQFGVGRVLTRHM